MIYSNKKINTFDFRDMADRVVKIILVDVGGEQSVDYLVAAVDVDNGDIFILEEKN